MKLRLDSLNVSSSIQSKVAIKVLEIFTILAEKEENQGFLMTGERRQGKGRRVAGKRVPQAKAFCKEGLPGKGGRKAAVQSAGGKGGSRTNTQVGLTVWRDT